MDDRHLPGHASGYALAASRAIEPEAIPEIEQYELDGIPLFHLPAAGSTTLSLQFRVGRADEPVQHGGMTHLAEHLVMSAASRGTETSNGTTEPFRLTFIARGSPADATRFLRDICRAIERPPLMRMAEEANVLRTEAAGRSGSMPFSLRLMWQRTGYQGIGTYHLPELFLRNLDEERLRGWMAQHLVAGNAVIWVTGTLPDDLYIELPPGPRTPPPTMTWIPGLETPTLVIEEAPAVGASFFVERSVASATAFRTIDRRLRQALRVDRGLGYDVGGEYTPVSADHAMVGLWATCLPDAVQQVERVILDTLDAMAQAGATTDEIEQQYERFTREAADPATFPGRLDAQARDALLGEDPMSAADLAQAYWRLQPGDVADAMRRAMDTMILVLPPGGTPPQRPFKPYPGPPLGSMGQGRVFELVSDKRKKPWGKTRTPRLVVGHEGVAVDSAGVTRRLVGIRWEDCVGVIHESDGRTLVSRDGYSLAIIAGEWREGEYAVALVDRFAPRDVVVPRGA
jgi:Peptidase M16 inactive domain